MIADRAYAPGKDFIAAAQELAADTVRYDEKYTVPLRNALITKEFGDMPSVPAATAAGAAKQ